MHYQIAASFRPGNFLLQAEPEMDSGTDVVFAGNLQNLADSLVEPRMIILFRNSQAQERSCGPMSTASSPGTEQISCRFSMAGVLSMLTIRILSPSGFQIIA